MYKGYKMARKRTLMVLPRLIQTIPRDVTLQKNRTEAAATKAI